MTFWVTLDQPVKHGGRDRQSFSVDGTEKKAREQVAAAFPDRTVVTCQALPYPGEPRLNYKTGSMPSFCLHPDKCAGRSSCPRNISCSE